ncbi:MAG: thiamine pyrophosphate-binding protein [Gammaproteobacteria bacterium]
MSKNGATLVVSTLSAIGVRTIFTLSGNQIMPIFDACIEAGYLLALTCRTKDFRHQPYLENNAKIFSAIE